MTLPLAVAAAVLPPSPRIGIAAVDAWLAAVRLCTVVCMRATGRARPTAQAAAAWGAVL